MNYRLLISLLVLVFSCPKTVAAPADRVDGTLILANENAGWCWYQDEKILHDPANNSLHFSTTGNFKGYLGKERNGDIDHVSLDLHTRDVRRSKLDNLPYVNGKGDDHNIGALWLRPDGRYLHVWSGHNNDHFTRYRISEKPHDATTWRPLQKYSWEDISGRPSSRKFTYSNVHFLAAEREGMGRLYNIGRGDQNSSNISYSDDHGETWHYAGKLTTFNGSSPSSYSNGYFKYKSNGQDRIDFIATEHHPRNYNNSVYHGYLQDGKTYNSFGEVVDDNIYDEKAPDPKDFTPVFVTNPRDGENDDQEHHTAWTIELELTPDGHPVALYTTRFGSKKAGNGNNPGAADHRIFYARFDGKKWHSTELGKMGGPLLGSEQDYVGLGAIHPNNPGYLVLSTPFDPANGKELGNHEIFEGRSGDAGKTWQWKQITFDSTVDNLRPAIPAWDKDHTAIFWMRGTYWHQSDYDQALVGVIREPAETTGKAFYIAADPSNNQGPPTATIITAPEDGTYDLFAWFWSPDGEDGRVAVGTSRHGPRVFRSRNCQQVAPEDFSAAVRTRSDGRSLYQAYLGRVELEKGETATISATEVPAPESKTPGVIDGFGYRLVK